MRFVEVSLLVKDQVVEHLAVPLVVSVHDRVPVIKRILYTVVHKDAAGVVGLSRHRGAQILLVILALHERIGFGTIIDALLTGNFVQMYNDLNPLPENRSLWLGIAVMLAGFVFMALGMLIYMKAAQCCGPRDSLLVGLGKRMPKIPIGIVEIILWAAVLLFGWLLGGPVGIGTLISTFGAGAVMQLVYSILHFEPRDIRHRDVFEIVRLLAGSRS